VIRLDGDAVRQARLDLGLSQRALAKAVGIGPWPLIKLENGETGPSSEITLPMLQRLVDTLGVPLTALLADDTPSTPDATGARAPEHGPDDMAALGALLLHTRVNTSKTELADSLGWTLDRLRLAARALDHHLRPLGMNVHSVRGGYLLRPYDGYKNSSRTRIDRITSARTGLQHLAARLIHTARNGTLNTQNISGADRPQLARLLRDRILTADGKTALLGPALLDALDVPE
jgi:transcriptional regulator with XRE-family HTH domain